MSRSSSNTEDWDSPIEWYTSTVQRVMVWICSACGTYIPYGHAGHDCVWSDEDEGYEEYNYAFDEWAIHAIRFNDFNACVHLAMDTPTIREDEEEKDS